jgi:rhodanese-related sulfurtransferase
MKENHPMFRTAIASISAITILLGLAACAPSSTSAPAPTVSVAEDTILIDVRSSEEYATGHLDGSLLLDLNGGDLANALPTLDPDVEYLVYCRSGSRAGQAAALMEQAGISDVTNLGSVDDAAAATGIPIVR